MARSAAIQVENDFTKGLITENTALNFPENACTEASNCVFDETGRVTRRGAIDIEQSYELEVTGATIEANEVYSEFLWNTVAGTGSLSFHVQQRGSKLYFYDVSSSTTVSQGIQATVVDMTSFTALNTSHNPALHFCQYTQGNGDLIVVNKACDPFYVAYDSVTGLLTATLITIKYRDFLGLESYAPTLRPSFADIASMKVDATGAYHFYNLLNQGWWVGAISGGSPDSNSALGQWDTARTDMPSLNDIPAFFRASPSDAFDPARVGAYDQGSSSAVRGHFILNLGEADRYAALTDAGYTLALSTDADSTVSHTIGSSIGNFTNMSYAYDGATTGSASTSLGTTDTTNIESPWTLTSTSDRYIGRDYGDTNKIRVAYAYCQNKYDLEFDGTGSGSSYGYDFLSVFQSPTGTRTATHTVTLRLYASNTAPTSASNGTLLGTTVRSASVVPATYIFGNTSSTPGASYRMYASDSTESILPSSLIGIPSNDTTTEYRYVWIRITGSTTFTTAGAVTGSTVTSTIDMNSKISNYENRITKRVTTTTTGALPSADVTPERPTTCAFFAGRVWYSGVNTGVLGNTLYFSKIAQQPSDYGLCYQQNDPTSEFNADILPNDGGTIQIPEMGRVTKLYNYQTSLIIFATNGVWIISANDGFTPTNFNIRKISSLGTNSPQSFVDIRGVPYWWGEDGILQISYNPQFDSFSVDDVTQTNIRSFFFDIPPDKRQYVKGAYDVRESIVYWLYDDVDLTYEYGTSYYTKVLAFNTLSQAFYPWEFSDSTPKIRGISYVQDSTGISDPSVKYSFSYPSPDDADLTKMGFANVVANAAYADWDTYATDISLNTDDAVTYESYFVTGYKVHGETLKFVQPNYVLVFLEQEEGAGCFIQGVFDFTTDEASGKWGSKQQIYNANLTNRSINYRRLKIRGKGRSIQFKFTNDGIKPFTIIGWGGLESVNREV